MHNFKSTSLSIGLRPTELHGISKKSSSIALKGTLIGDTDGAEIDANMWLPMASATYQISPNLGDYILVPVPSIITELPNTNGDSASKEEMLRFNAEQGAMAYKTFKGKPTFSEHANKDVTKAKGVILDVFLRPLPQFRGNHLKLVKLLAFDRTKDSELCRKILAREINTYSMGMWYKQYVCSFCGHVATNSKNQCIHTNIKRKTYLHPSQNKLVYRQCMFITGFETSSVSDPAYVIATSDTIMNPEAL